MVASNITQYSFSCRMIVFTSQCEALLSQIDIRGQLSRPVSHINQCTADGLLSYTWLHCCPTSYTYTVTRLELKQNFLFQQHETVRHKQVHDSGMNIGLQMLIMVWWEGVLILVCELYLTRHIYIVKYVSVESLYLAKITQNLFTTQLPIEESDYHSTESA